MNFHEEFIRNVLNYFLSIKQTNKINTNIIRKHSEKLSKSGDYSFPVNINSWKYLLNNTIDKSSPESKITIHAKTIFEATKTDSNEIIIQSKKNNWQLPIERINIKLERCLLFLNRSDTFNHVILYILNNMENYGKINHELLDEKKEITLIQEIDEEQQTNYEQNLTEYRSNLLTTILRNILHNFCGYEKINNDVKSNKNCTTILITHRSTLKSNDNNNYLSILNLKTILCGGVRYQIDNNDQDHGNKSITMSANEYIKKRSIDIELMAQHKYGIRVKNEDVFINLIQKLGLAAVIVDLLEVKHSSTVKLPFTNHSGGVSRGAAFILYNSARIETIFSTFSQKVTENYYPPLPDLNSIDLTVLKEEEEWELLFNYIMEFPNIISRSISDIECSGQVAPHLICHFLSGLVGCFSVYYRRCRILTENREHLLPILYARLILLKCVRIVLNKSLAILNIEPVKQM